MKPLIKICGVNDIQILHELIMIDEVNFIGFIFYNDSPRNVTDNFLQKISKIDFKNKRPVCVYVNSSKEHIQETSSYFKDPILQFHGDEPAGFCESFDRKYIKAFHAYNLRYWKNYMDLYSSAHAFLIDSGNSVQKGGTGIAFDWKLIPKTEKEKIIVAGGINSSNVSDLLSKKNNIFGIDVNSGLESKETIKDIEKIETFFKVLKKNGK